MEFQVNLNEVDIINSASDENEFLKRALTLIHKDVILFKKQACQIYCENRIIEGLVARLHSSKRNSLVVALSISLLRTIISFGGLYRERLMRINSIEDGLISLILPNNIEDDVVARHEMQTIHEEALKLLVALSSHSSKFQQALASRGIFKELKELLIYNQSESSHSKCCYNHNKFNEQSRDFTKSLIEGKKLIGKVDPHESAEAKKGRLNILAVNLYDTTTDRDIHINQELIDHGFAWPERQKVDGEEQKKENEDDIWCDFIITKVVDANCFWAHIECDVEKKIQQISRLLEEHVYSSDVCPLQDTEVGTRVCLSLKKDKCTTTGWVRGCVMENDQENHTCTVLLMDYGYVVKVDEDQLFPMPAVLKQMQSQANLCVLKGLKAKPKNTGIVEQTLALLCNITLSRHNFRMILHQMGLTMQLIQLCAVPDRNIIIRTVALLGNLALNFNIRAQIGAMNGMKLLTDLLMKYRGDNDTLKYILGCLLNTLVECTQNRKRVAKETDVLLVLVKLHGDVNTTNENRKLVLRCIKTLVGNGWQLMDPVNTPDIREIMEDKMSTIKGCFNFVNMCGDELLGEVKKRRQYKILKRGLRNHEALPDPTYASLTVEDLIGQLKGTTSGTSDEDKGTLVASGGDSNGDDCSGGELELNKSLVNFDGFLYRRRFEVFEDNCHCFMLRNTIKEIKSIEIANTICALLNSGHGGKILIGISKVGLTVGVNIGRKDRDNLRLGVDHLLQRFTPSVKHKYEINFMPVMTGEDVQSLHQYEERYVIVIVVERNSLGTVYQTPAKKIFFRKDGKNSECSIQEIRTKTIEEQEEKHQLEIKALRMTLEETKQKLKNGKR